MHEQKRIMNRMDMTRARKPENRLLEGAAGILRDYGVDWGILQIEPDLGRHALDAIVEIGQAGRKTKLVVETKLRPRTAQAGAIVAQLRQHRLPALLLADYINPELAEELRRNEIGFLDMEGNAYLRGDGLLIWITGRKETRRMRFEREARRAFQPTGLKVIFALLCRPELVEKDYRTLANVAGVALGTVQWIMRDLVQEGYVQRKGRTERRLVRLDRLLDEWALGYARDLQPRQLLGRYETRRFDAWRETDLRKHAALWGGEAAAALITGYLKPGTLTIWAEKPTARLLAELGLRLDEKGRVQIRQVFWNRDVEIEGVDEQVTEHVPPIADRAVPPVLVYAELLAIGEARTLETAQRIRDEWIDRPFERYRARAAR
jgi:hypothetical protein